MAFLKAGTGARGAVLLVLSTMLFPAEQMTGAELAAEYGVKAAYLANLFSYVEWPPGHVAQKTLCVLGRDPFGPMLEQTVEQYRGSVKVRRLGEGQNPNKQCSMLFVAHGTPRRFSRVLESALQSGVLTVSENPDAGALAGVVVLETNDQDHRVRLAVHIDTATEHGFRISSRLLAMARLIRNTGAGR